jgi:hypothetical protein
MNRKTSKGIVITWRTVDPQNIEVKERGVRNLTQEEMAKRKTKQSETRGLIAVGSVRCFLFLRLTFEGAGDVSPSVALCNGSHLTSF